MQESVCVPQVLWVRHDLRMHGITSPAMQRQVSADIIDDCQDDCLSSTTVLTQADIHAGSHQGKAHSQVEHKQMTEPGSLRLSFFHWICFGECRMSLS